MSSGENKSSPNRGRWTKEDLDLANELLVNGIQKGLTVASIARENKDRFPNRTENAIEKKMGQLKRAPKQENNQDVKEDNIEHTNESVKEECLSYVVDHTVEIRVQPKYYSYPRTAVVTTGEEVVVPKSAELPKSVRVEEKVIVEDKSETFSNRALRIFEQNGISSNDILRVNFKDKKLIEKGTIEYEGTTFNLLSASNSGMRTGSFWYISNKHNRDYVLSILGTFEKAKRQGIRKVVGRQGLSFGTSLASVEVKESEWKLIKDYLHNDFNFTDGIGIITESLANRIANAIKPQLQNGTFDLAPSAFQIRFLGFKGVVVQYPDDSKVIRNLRELHKNEKLQMFLRESMHKFEGTDKYNYIDVLNISKSIPAGLSRHFMMVLESCQVPPDVILQQKFIPFMNKVKLAKTNLDSLIELTERDHNISEITNAIMPVSESVYRLAVLLKQDVYKIPFVNQYIDKEIKKKVEKFLKDYSIPERQSKYLMGGVDEAGVLKEGEVYVSYGKVILDDTKVIVTRNPCVHSGDMRVLKCVNHESLSHIRDMILFPKSNCKRPHQDMMGGGDLDGDLYWVCWDHLMVSHFKEEESHDYSKPHDNSVSTSQEDKDYLKVFKHKDQIGLLEYYLRIYAEENGGMTSYMYKDYAKMYSSELDGHYSDSLNHRQQKVGEKSWMIVGKLLKRGETKKALSEDLTNGGHVAPGGIVITSKLFNVAYDWLKQEHSSTQGDDQKTLQEDPLRSIIKSVNVSSSEYVQAKLIVKVWREFFQKYKSDEHSANGADQKEYFIKRIKNRLSEVDQFVSDIRHVFEKGYVKGSETLKSYKHFNRYEIDLAPLEGCHLVARVILN
ncbi:RNA-dependent RNA polymerase [Acrasis kona]|uniref:RNA-dependent RNA polymerase n=1 Tax=Acrasis kona TaxID=1008807 RepID=A0AAW2Z5U4_9EUKA